SMATRRCDAPGTSGVPGAAARGTQRATQLAAGTDAELREHLAEVVLDGAGADEQLTADLGVRVAVRGQRRDLRLLRCEQILSVDAAGAGGASGRDQFPTGPVRKRSGAERVEH